MSSCKAQSPVVVYFDPLKVQDESLVPNSTFNITLKIDNIPDVPGAVGLEFKILWNSSVLNGVKMYELFFHEVMPPDEIEDNLWKLAANVGADSVDYSYTFLNYDRAKAGGYAPVSGNHSIVKITMKVVGVGQTALNINVSKVGGPKAVRIEHTDIDGFFSNVPPPPPPKAALLYVDPTKTVDSSLTSGKNFTVNLNIINASSMAGLEFKLGFNATLLHANSVARGGFIPVSVTPTTQIDNTAGFALFNVSLSTPLDGDGTVAMIQFQVLADNVRNTALHLYDVKLVDNTGQSLLFTTADGSFTNAPTLLGDINGNGIVDIEDAILASEAFGHSLGDLGYNPAVDINGNGVIDIFDYILLAGNFGKKL